ncbi:MAG TPA: hypothetical protein VES60_08285, partial [Nakamurella sp.]|nr:hypothetical protein [Nakamurella sp.]
MADDLLADAGVIEHLDLQVLDARRLPAITGLGAPGTHRGWGGPLMPSAQQLPNVGGSQGRGLRRPRIHD